jgi:hypothetical protein
MKAANPADIFQLLICRLCRLNEEFSTGVQFFVAHQKKNN